MALPMGLELTGHITGQIYNISRNNTAQNLKEEKKCVVSFRDEQRERKRVAGCFDLCRRCIRVGLASKELCSVLPFGVENARLHGASAID